MKNSRNAVTPRVSRNRRLKKSGALPASPRLMNQTKPTERNHRTVAAASLQDHRFRRFAIDTAATTTPMNRAKTGVIFEANNCFASEGKVARVLRFQIAKRRKPPTRMSVESSRLFTTALIDFNDFLHCDAQHLLTPAACRRSARGAPGTLL